MILINAIIFSNYMFCEVYRSHPEDPGGDRISAGYPPSGNRVPGPGVLCWDAIGGGGEKKRNGGRGRTKWGFSKMGIKFVKNFNI